MTFVGLDFISTLQNILSGVFDTVLAPVLRDVMSVLINAAGELINGILSNFLLRIWIILLKLIYFMEQIFNVFSGISPVEVTTNDVSKKITLLEYFSTLSDVKRAFLYITLIAVVLAFLATILAVTRSMSDMLLQDRHPLSTVFRQALKASVTFMLIPFTCLFLLQLTTKITVIINDRFNDYVIADDETKDSKSDDKTEDSKSDDEKSSAYSSMSDVLFISAAGMAAKSDKAKKDYASGQKYEDAEAVKNDFNIEKFDYVLAYVSSLLVILLMLCCILQFIQRIIMLLLLFLVSPFFVAYMPLDEGARFREWREMFVAQMVSAFGPILVMQLYFIIVPSLVGGSMTFGTDTYTECCIRLFIVIGGAFAVYRSRLLIISVINPSAAGSMAESGIIGSIVAGKLMGGMGRVGGKARGGMSRAYAAGPSPVPMGGFGGGAEAGSSQAFTGK